MPAALGGLTLQLHAGEFQPRATYSVNGQRVSADSLGRITLCAPCTAGSAVEFVLHPNGAYWWDPPVLRVADLGWHEMHDGAEWARFFTRDSTLPVPSDSVAGALAAAAVQPDKAQYHAIVNHWSQLLAPAVAKVQRDPDKYLAVVAAERAAKRPTKRADVFDRAAAELRALPALGSVAIAAGDDEFVVLLARAGRAGNVDVIKRVENKGLLDSILRKTAA